MIKVSDVLFACVEHNLTTHLSMERGAGPGGRGEDRRTGGHFSLAFRETGDPTLT